jgi:hypothetical protein
MNSDIQSYNEALSQEEKDICNSLAKIIIENLDGANYKIWHAHPVWFIEGNPIVGYSKLKGGIRLLFWSGQSFDEEALKAEGSFKAAEIRFSTVEQINSSDIKRYLDKSKKIQWDYKNLIKRKGKLERLV